MENKIRFSEVLKKYTMVIVLALVIILFTVNTGGKMLLPQNVNNLICIYSCNRYAVLYSDRRKY